MTAADAGILTSLSHGARGVLDANWLGASTLPSRTLYPHQWSWDSAFIALGRSWYDEARAQQELRSLFRAQWADGRVPHIVFNPSVGEEAYFPGPAFWQSSKRSAAAPRDVETSGITQPPIHARAALEMHRHARDVEASKAFLGWLYPRLVAEHDYLADRRRPTGTDLPVIVHPWESGLDNSPVWDRDLTQIAIPSGGLPAYLRHDLDHANAADRPTNEAYDRFVYLAAAYRDTGYDDARLLDTVPFLVAGPLFNAIHLWSTHALAEIAMVVGADPTRHREDAQRIHDALLSELWDPDMRRFCALDVVRRERSAEDTIVSFAPLLDPDLPADQLASIMGDLRSAHFHPDRPTGYVAPSYDLLGTGFDERRYWRGPIWINTNWLLWAGLTQHGQTAEADQILLSSLHVVAQSGFHEYFDPFGGAGFGTDGFGWTAALTLDLVERHQGPAREQLLKLLGAAAAGS
ncbi:MAG TPA: trehalase family glycosidase [Candidatus Limnocylindrales bacterium]